MNEHLTKLDEVHKSSDYPVGRLTAELEAEAVLTEFCGLCIAQGRGAHPRIRTIHVA